MELLGGVPAVPIQSGQLVFVESTAEGQEGGFYSICQAAQAKQRLSTPLTPLDFKFHFFPWWTSHEYSLDVEGFVVPEQMAKYFETLELEHNIPLTLGQKTWYIKKEETQEDDMKREYPSTPEEAFEASVEGAYFGKHMAKAELEGRVLDLPHNPNLPVETAWDIGVNDETSIWFFQRAGKWCHFIDYYECSDEYLPHFVDIINGDVGEPRRKAYRYSKFWLPPDVKVREWGAGRSRVESMIAKGIKPSPLKADYAMGDLIQAGRLLVPQSKFDANNTVLGRKSLKNYRKQWDDKLGAWRDAPFHNWASNGASAFMYAAMVYDPVKDEPKPETKIPKHVGNMTGDELWKVQDEGRSRV